MTIFGVSHLAVLLGSVFVCFILVLTQHWHGRLSMDHDLNGVQKLHDAPVPRVGGIAIALGLALGAVVSYLRGAEGSSTMFLLLLASLPVFVAGLIEDLTKRVSVRTRLLASFGAAALAAWLLDAHIDRLDMGFGIDPLMQVGVISVFVTCFIVGGITNSVNIIDGLNGLASGSVVIILAGLGLVAWQFNDAVVLQLCLAGAAACLGFMVFNFPAGRIFLGDGGAYLAGFWMAECAVLLLVRNPDASGWAVLLSCFYPVWETVFSMYRRRVLRGAQMGRPDRVHLHQLIFRRLVTVRIGSHQPAALKHGLAAPVMWLLVLLCQVFAVLGQGHLGWVLGGAALFLTGYHGLYHAMLIRVPNSVIATRAGTIEPDAEPARLSVLH